MEVNIPSAIELRAELERLSHAQMQELSRLSGVPFTTLWKIRAGDTENPGIETARRFMPHIAEAAAQLADGPVENRKGDRRQTDSVIAFDPEPRQLPRRKDDLETEKAS